MLYLKIQHSISYLFHIFLLLLLGVCTQASANETSHIFDAAVITDWSSNSSSKNSITMDARRDNGLPWIFYYYVSAKEQGGGESRFGVMPEGIAVNAMDTQFHFSEKSMTNGLPTSLSALQNFIHQNLPDFNGDMTPSNLNSYPADNIRYQSFLKVYNYEELLKAPSYFTINLVETEGLKPIALYMISGQGEVPDEIKQLIKDSNGSWFGRYRHIIYTLLIALCGVYLIYRFATR